MGHIIMAPTNIMVRWSHKCPWKGISQIFQDFFLYIRLMEENEERIKFWEDLWWESNL